MTNRKLLRSAGRSVALLLFPFFLPIPTQLQAAPPTRLNVLLVVADDLNCDLGSYTPGTAHTPHLDRLAARGVRFERAYSQFPLCSPSRSSFLTGRRPDATGVLRNPSPATPLSPHFREKIPQTITLPQAFKQAGWISARIGKLYHYGVPLDIGTGSLDDFHSWDYAVNPRGRDREEHDRIFSLRPGFFGATLSWLAADGTDEEQTDGIATTDALELLERYRNTGRPFFLGVGFYRPHTPYVAPRKWFDLYPPDGLQLASLSADDRSRTPAAAYNGAYPEEDAMTETLQRQAIQGYRATISFVDAQVGRLLDGLDQLGLADSTIVVFTSDHGYHLGDHGLWQKRSLFERANRVPLIIALPQMKNQGRTAPGVVELIDIYPTLAELCDVPAPDYLDGSSLVRILQDPDVRVKDAAYSQVGEGRALTPAVPRAGYAVRTEQWRYIEWNSDAPENRQLFHMARDPNEETNLALDPAHAAVVIEMRALLQTKFPFRWQK